MDDDAPVVNVTTGTGDVDTRGKTSAPPVDMTIDDTNNPTGMDGTMPMGPNDNTHIANSDTAASPTLTPTENTYPLPVALPGNTGANVSSKKRRRSGGPARAAREAAFSASKSHDTTKDTQT